jgi:STE24 endopeptidase
MKALVWTIAGLFVVLFGVTTFIPYEPAREAAIAAGFDEADIETGLRFAFERRLLMWAATAIHLGLLCVLALTSCSRRWADRFLGWTGQRRILAVVGVGLVYVVLSEILSLPIGIARHYHAEAWGMSNLDLAGWLREHYLAFAIQTACEAILLVGFYALLIVLPRMWWLIAPLGASAFAVAYAFLSPILISPLFNDFTPLSETRWQDQQSRVRALIDKAGIPVEEILVMNASKQSKHTNAYFAGFGSTRRIVLYDNLLKEHTPDEIESVLAHEIGHWQHDHIVKGILLGMLAALGGCLLLDRLLRGAMGRPPWQLTSKADPAGLPIVLFAMYLGSWIAMPVENAVIRHFEVQADQASLELAGQPEAFIRCEQKLARVNKSNVAPTPWNAWLFNTHPTTVERIRMAEEWKTR